MSDLVNSFKVTMDLLVTGETPDAQQVELHAYRDSTFVLSRNRNHVKVKHIDIEKSKTDDGETTMTLSAPPLVRTDKDKVKHLAYVEVPVEVLDEILASMLDDIKHEFDENTVSIGRHHDLTVYNSTEHDMHSSHKIPRDMHGVLLVCVEYAGKPRCLLPRERES